MESCPSSSVCPRPAARHGTAQHQRWRRRGAAPGGLFPGLESELAAALGLRRCRHILWANDTGLLNLRSSDFPCCAGSHPLPRQMIQTNRGGVSVPTENCISRGLLGATPKSVAFAVGCPSFPGYTRAGLSNALKSYCSKWENVPFTLDLSGAQRNERSHSKDQHVAERSRKGPGIGSGIPRGFSDRKGIGFLQTAAPVRLSRCRALSGWWARGAGSRGGGSGTGRRWRLRLPRGVARRAGAVRFARSSRWVVKVFF